MIKGTVTRRPPEAEPRVRRGYFECRYGQLHVHNAIPPGGGFEEGTPLLCIHGLTASAQVFHRLLAPLGHDRSVYAPDLPGFGDSDAPPQRATVADLALALGDFLDSMRFRQIDVLGYQFGALVAAELATARPQQVRRVVLASVPILTDAERNALRQTFALHPADDANWLGSEWRRLREAHGPAVPHEICVRLLASRLNSAQMASTILAGEKTYDTRAKFSAIAQPTLVLRLRDDFWEATPRVRELLPKMRFVELTEDGNAALEVAPETIVTAMKDFLRG